ncbi:MAG: F420-dependent oxidoreductase, partial [Marmoricola sp.]
AVVERLVKYGHGFHPLGRPTAEDLAVIRDAMAAAGRDIADLEMVGGVRYRFPDNDSLADLAESMASIPEQLEQGFTTICIKPSMYIDDQSDMESFCKDVMKRAEAMG